MAPIMTKMSVVNNYHSIMSFHTPGARNAKQDSLVNRDVLLAPAVVQGGTGLAPDLIAFRRFFLMPEFLLTARAASQRPLANMEVSHDE